MSGFTLLGWILSLPTPPSSKADQLFSTPPPPLYKSQTHFHFSLQSINNNATTTTTTTSDHMDASSSSSDHHHHHHHQRLFNRERTLHQILGEGFIADVMLWRRGDLSLGTLVVTVASWVVFEKSGYTFLSLVSSVLLLLFAILFLWSKSAHILNRPPPPLPDLQLSEEFVNEAAALFRSRLNTLLLVSRDISLGKDSKLFFKVATCMWLTSVVGSWTDFLTLIYTSILVCLAVPVLYEKYEDHVDKHAIILYRELRRLYLRLDQRCLSKIRDLILEKRKLS